MVREPTLNYLNNLNSWNSSSIFLWSGIWSISVTVLCTWKRDVISAADCSVFIRSFGAFISCPVQIYVFPIFMSLFILHRENSFKFSASVTARSSFSRLCPARIRTFWCDWLHTYLGLWHLPDRSTHLTSWNILISSDLLSERLLCVMLVQLNEIYFGSRLRWGSFFPACLLSVFISLHV